MRRRRVMGCLFFVVFFPLSSAAFTLTFTPPSTNTDGSDLTDLAGTALYYRAPGTTTWSKVGEVGPTATTVTVEPPMVGEWVVRAVNSVGIESENSNSVVTRKPTKPVVTGTTR